MKLTKIYYVYIVSLIDEWVWRTDWIVLTGGGNTFFSCGTSTRFRVMASPYRTSRPHLLDKTHSVRLLWTSDHPDAETYTRQYKRQTFILWTGFEPPIPKSERSQTHALDRAGKTELLSENTINVSIFPPQFPTWTCLGLNRGLRAHTPPTDLLSHGKFFTRWTQFPQDSKKRQIFLHTVPYGRRRLWSSDCCDVRLRATWYIWYGTRMLVTRHDRPAAGHGRS